MESGKNIKASSRKKRPRNGPSKEYVGPLRSGKRGGRKIEHRTKNHVEKHTQITAAHHGASRRARRCHDVISVAKLQQVSPGRQRVVGFSWQEAQQLVVRDLKNGWRAPNRLLVVQTGDSASQAKVFKAHAVPQGLCENLFKRSSCWPTSKNTEIIQSKALWQNL